MIVYYLDSSAWVKRYYLEPGSHWVSSLFFGDRTLASSALGFLEVWAVFIRKSKGREISSSVLQEKLNDLENDWRGFLKIQLNSEILDRAKEVISRFALRSADAIHLASAAILQDQAIPAGDEIILVTSDRELKAAALSLNLKINDPNESNE